MDDVIIIGAGIVGTAIARELAKYQIKVRILEKGNDVSLGATKANSAIVHGGFAEAYPSLKATLCVKGRKQFAALNEELQFGYRQNGSLVLAPDEDVSGLEELMERGKLLGIDNLSILNQEEIRLVEPNLSNVSHALYCPDSGICSPYEMAIAMAENAIANGVELELNSEVLGIEIERDSEISSFVVRCQASEYRCRYLINAAGIAAGEIASMLGDDSIHIKPVSGEYVLFVRGSGNGLNHTIFQLPSAKGKGVLATPTYYDNLLIGPDALEGDTTQTHEDRLVAIYQQVKQFYPKLIPAQFIRSFAGVRAKEASGDFVIRPSRIQNFFHVAGIQSPGLTSAPAIAEMVVAMLQEAGMVLSPNDAFNPIRQPIVIKKALKKVADTQPLLDLSLGSPGRMVCRCEQVLEEEIVDALHRGIAVTSIDGVKRRTRAGMGWCQGGYCHDRVLEVMERECGDQPLVDCDVEHSGTNRIGKSAFLAYLKQEEEKELTSAS